jgi:hypothetical protein
VLLIQLLPNQVLALLQTVPGTYDTQATAAGHSAVQSPGAP